MTMRQRLTHEDWIHPECGNEEILFGHMTSRAYDALPFDSKRRGSATRGKVPVFIHLKELTQLGENQVYLLAALREVWATPR